MRRTTTVLVTAALAGSLLPSAAVAGTPRPAPAPSGVRVALPTPTGSARLGMTELHLVDRSRPDPWVPSRPYRELMVSLWYPAKRADGYRRAPAMPPNAAAHFGRTAAEQEGFAGADRVDWAGIRGHARAGAPAKSGRRPVLLLSPGNRMPRTLNTALAEEMAGHGYVVVSIDHTHNPMGVEFPGGRVEPSRQPPSASFDLMRKEYATRSADARFVLDSLERLARGGNPDAGRRALPRGLKGALDLTRVGMFGHSLGGASSAQAMSDDRRIDAGVDLDGGFVSREGPLGPVVERGLDRPFMIVNADRGSHDHPSIRPFWDGLRGWRRSIQVAGTEHHSFSDLQAYVPRMVRAGVTPKEFGAALVGTIDPARSFAVQGAYVRSFFDLHLRKRDDHLLDGPSPRFPEVRFLP
ncbi:alpha/beta hydrolase family protein [Actinomadura kijaniata]|uniref:alpha/beta hydrolase family protein n=1 Tax=Actinomadura kijaniata TaxID=46161 RepID=UPI0008372B6E|nr:hypothetical protein [Actinomadura kijaniata]